MKHIDLEKLERKNIYSEPSDDFFLKMQEKVLARVQEQDVVPTKEKGRIIRLQIRRNWSYLAAALVIFLGFGFYIGLGNEQVEIRKGIDNTLVQNEELITEERDHAEVLPENDAYTINEGPVEVKTLAATNNQSIEVMPKAKVQSRPVRRASAVPVRNASLRSDAVDQIITSLSSQDLAELSRDAEMDVYLDLY